MKSILAPLALLCAAVQAQPAMPVPPAPPAPAALASLAGGPWKDERVIQGAPYCADAVHETVQTLADGNRIVRRRSARLCRDGQGRTRQEVERGGRRVVYLHDPATRERWLLDPERREARRSAGAAGFHLEQLIDGEAWREYGERTTWTIEAGALGNEKPIEIVREVWTSPELMLTLATRDFDPRGGEVSYRLQNLRRAEPDPALMKVPEGFSRK